ncbi:N-acetylglucosamine-1-phosphotransferase subunit gamma-like [Stegodyphus dumicola]|uniref:N-acetylglucosamine-1-phosphotransferase subunit gamma-like n=1 Tax=Stegodyphus dumicola TaxID=202533 RepID=UPI0015B19C67|nr:N-acetylglucosamine-1-phosphotransferase subunit gamma-like [Stegodyphus dumicola]
MNCVSFQNITQYEISPRWNAYHGILGIWSHWDIENNTFSSMIYTHGDHCGNINRKVKVLLECGFKEELSNVTEPERCQYVAIFKSKYVCNSDALLVYPRLDPESRHKWDQLITDLHYGFITEKGYQAGLQKLFQSAGLAETRTAKPPDVATTETTFSAGNTFSDLLSCNKEYKNLQNEISQLNQELEALKLLLDLNKIQNRTNKPK